MQNHLYFDNKEELFRWVLKFSVLSLKDNCPTKHNFLVAALNLCKNICILPLRKRCTSMLSKFLTFRKLEGGESIVYLIWVVKFPVKWASHNSKRAFTASQIHPRCANANNCLGSPLGSNETLKLILGPVYSSVSPIPNNIM